MKFKLFLIVFNILLVFLFIIMYLLPFFMFGKSFAIFFLKDSWFLIVLFGLVIIAMNTLYFVNRRLVLSLENRNWQELKDVLEERLFQKKCFRNIYIRLYVNTCIALSKINEIKKLEKELRFGNVRKLEKNVLQFGLPYMLEGDPEKIKLFFSDFLFINNESSGWVCWNYCFALLLLKEKEEAVSMLKELVSNSRDTLLILLSLYMLSPFKEQEPINKLIDSKFEILKTSFEGEKLDKEIKKQKENVQMLFIDKIVRDAYNWLITEAT